MGPPNIRESVRYHFGSGSGSKIGGLVIQAVQVLLVAKVLGQSGFGRFSLLWTICTLVTSAGAAWASAYQNQMVDARTKGMASVAKSATISVLSWTAGIIVFLDLSAPLLQDTFAGIAVLHSVPRFERCVLYASTMVLALSALQISILSACGESIRLGRQQNAGKILALLFVLGFWITRATPNPVQMLAGLQFFGSIPAFASFVPFWLEPGTETRREAYTTILRRFSCFGLTNVLVSIQRIIELNLVAAFGGAAGAGTFGLAQKLFTPVSSVFVAGARNLWPYLRRGDQERRKGFTRSVRKLRLLGLMCVGLLLVSFIIAQPLILAVVGFQEPPAVAMIIVVAVQTFYLIWVSFSFNLFAALGKEKFTLWINLAQAAALMVLWIALGGWPDNWLLFAGLVAEYILAIYACNRFEQLVSEEDDKHAKTSAVKEVDALLKPAVLKLPNINS